MSCSISDRLSPAKSARLDVTDPVTISRAASWVRDHVGRLDVLFDNAGIARDHSKKPTETTLRDFRETYETNLFGAAMVTNAVLPMLLDSMDGRIINQSINQSAALGSHSATARMERPLVKLNWLAYNSSKAALNSITSDYAELLSDTSVEVVATSPGRVATALDGHIRDGMTPAEGARIAMRLAVIDPPPPNGRFGVMPDNRPGDPTSCPPWARRDDRTRPGSSIREGFQVRDRAP